MTPNNPNHLLSLVHRVPANHADALENAMAAWTLAQLADLAEERERNGDAGAVHLLVNKQEKNTRVRKNSHGVCSHPLMVLQVLHFLSQPGSAT